MLYNILDITIYFTLIITQSVIICDEPMYHKHLSWSKSWVWHFCFVHNGSKYCQSIHHFNDAVFPSNWAIFHGWQKL